MAERVVLIDGSALVFRAYYALPLLATSKGLHTNAIYGFATMFQKVMAGRTPALGAVVFDPPGPTFREERYAGYKAERRAMPEELVEQLPWIDRLVAAHRFPVVRVPGFEADDVIGTLTRLALEAGHEVVIVSSDKDFAQLLGPRVRMLDTMRDVTYDPELAAKKWGVPPAQMVDWLALVGDEVDGIPGVKGIGAKGAAQLLARWGSLEQILAHVDELKGRQKSALEAHRADALLSRELATIRQDVPIEGGLAALVVAPPDTAELDALHRELEFYSLLSSQAGAHPADATPRDHAPLSDPAAVRAWLEEAQATGAPLAILACLEEPAPGHHPLAGLALADRPGRARYVPLRAPGLEVDLAGDPAWAFLRAWLEDEARPKVAHEWKELYLALRRRGVVARGCVLDTGLASFLIDPTKLIPHRLEQLSKEYLQRALPPAKSVLGAGQSQRPLSAAPPEEAAAWACPLADAVIELHPLLLARVEAEGHLAQLRERDLPLSTVLGEMEHAGIRVDREDLARLGEELRERLRGWEAGIHRLAGREFNIGSTKQLGQVLFEELELPVIKKTKTGWSTDEEVLQRLAPKHEIARLVLEQRKLAKLIHTYTDVLQREVDPTTGRIHCTFQQTAGATGRLITTHPDLQRTPVSSPEGQRIRRAFVTEPGWRLISADWSQIELRLLAHVSGDERLLAAFRERADVHARTAAQLFACAPEAVTPEQRRIGKTVNFATIYGQGATALGQILGIPRKEAQAYIGRFFELFAGVRAWLDGTIAEALERGSVSTILGRKRVIPELRSQDPMIRAAGERIAANTPLQGSAADICKLVMLELPGRWAAAGLTARLLLQIHDELVVEAPAAQAEATAAILAERMEHAVELRVPLQVKVGIGATWAEAHA